MRLAPIAIFYSPDIDAVGRYAAESSRTTHGAAECVDACRLLGRILCRALAGASKDDLLLGDDADTTAAVCGQVAGAHYGESGIPGEWLEKLAMRGEIDDLGERLRRKQA